MNILLTGASGFIGRNLSCALERAGHRIKPVSRRHGVDFRHLLEARDWLPHLDEIDAVINCVGIIGETRSQRFAPLHTLAPMALFRACEDAGVRRVLQISALGADKTAFSAYHLSKRAADDDLRNLDLDWFVLRPSLIYGRGGTSAEFFLRLARLPLLPVVADGQQALQPVHISDVVATAIRCLNTSQTRQTLDIVGAETVSFCEWLQRMREAQGLPRARLLHIPYPLALVLAHLGYRFDPMLHPENLLMLKRGFRADKQVLADFLERLPIAFSPQLFFADATGELS